MADCPRLFCPLMASSTIGQPPIGILAQRSAFLTVFFPLLGAQAQAGHRGMTVFAAFGPCGFGVPRLGGSPSDLADIFEGFAVGALKLKGFLGAAKCG